MKKNDPMRRRLSTKPLTPAQKTTVAEAKRMQKTLMRLGKGAYEDSNPRKVAAARRKEYRKTARYGGPLKRGQGTLAQRARVRNYGRYGRECEDVRKRVNRKGRCVLPKRYMELGKKIPGSNARTRGKYMRTRGQKALKCKAGYRVGRDSLGRRRCLKSRTRTMTHRKTGKTYKTSVSKTYGLRRKVHKTGKYANQVYYGKAKADRKKRPLSNYQKHMKGYLRARMKPGDGMLPMRRKAIFKQAIAEWKNAPMGSTTSAGIKKIAPKYASPKEFFQLQKAKRLAKPDYKPRRKLTAAELADMGKVRKVSRKTGKSYIAKKPSGRGGKLSDAELAFYNKHRRRSRITGREYIAKNFVPKPRKKLTAAELAKRGKVRRISKKTGREYIGNAPKPNLRSKKKQSAALALRADALREVQKAMAMAAAAG